MPTERGEITRLAQSWSQGNEAAFEELISLVYDDLCTIARKHLRLGNSRGSIDTTALVHEAFIKLTGVEEGEWEGRAQFFAFCSKTMRHILTDFARRRHAEKRGGTRVRVPLTEGIAAVDEEVTEMLALEEAMLALEKRNPRMVRIAECRFFGGLSVSETAAALSTSTRTVEREWARARAYLYQALAQDTVPPQEP